MSTWERIRHKRDVSSVPRVTAPGRNCANSPPKDRLSFGYCRPFVRAILAGQLIRREAYDIQQWAAPRFGAAAVERELYRETVPLARADWPEQIAHHAIAFHWKAAIEQPAQYALPVPLRLHVSASGTRRYERDAYSANPGNLRRAQFTLLSLKGNSPCTCAVRGLQNCTDSRRKNRLSFGQRAAAPVMSLWRQQHAMLDATSCLNPYGWLPYSAVNMRGGCRCKRRKERQRSCERPNTTSTVTDVRQSVCKRNGVEHTGHSPLGDFPQMVTRVALLRRESSQFLR